MQKSKAHTHTTFLTHTRNKLSISITESSLSPSLLPYLHISLHNLLIFLAKSNPHPNLYPLVEAIAGKEGSWMTGRFKVLTSLTAVSASPCLVQEQTSLESVSGIVARISENSERMVYPQALISATWCSKWWHCGPWYVTAWATLSSTASTRS